MYFYHAYLAAPSGNKRKPLDSEMFVLCNILNSYNFLDANAIRAVSVIATNNAEKYSLWLYEKYSSKITDRITGENDVCLS